MIIQAKHKIPIDRYHLSSMSVKEIDDLMRKEIAIKLTEEMIDKIQIYKNRINYDTIEYSAMINFDNK